MRPTTEQMESRDVVVIGGGPAGSTAAALVARGGHDVLLVDRESFPRFRIGESLMPATYWTLARLGVLDRMKQSPFPSKHSVQFFSESGRGSSPFYFSEVDADESSRTWQVDRSEFDRMLLDNAAAAGVEVRQRSNVKDVTFDDRGRATDVVLESADGKRRRVASKVVVDATGQTSLLARKLKLRQTDPKLRHAALYTRYRGARRDEGVDEGATLILRARGGRSWFWFIPLPDDLVSVGVVGPIEHLVGAAGQRPADVYARELDRCVALQARLQGAQQTEAVSMIRDFSYISRRIAGDGWVMAGDAFGFLDPIYSTGVFLALKSGELAADSILEAFRRNEFSAEVLGAHGPRYLEGMETMRKLVYAYYDKNFSIAGFLRAHPQHRDPVVNLLIGNVFRVSVDGLFDDMGREIELPASRSLDPTAPCP